MIKAIVCCAKDFGIGKKNGLLFDIPADMMHFRHETTGKICVFGYNTYLSLPKRPLKNRVNVVLWDQAPSMDCLEGAITFNNFNALLNFVQILAKQYDVYICGGQGVYTAFMPYYDLIDLTMVNAEDPEATAFFPNPADYGFDCHHAGQFWKEDGALGTGGYYIQTQFWGRTIKE